MNQKKARFLIVEADSKEESRTYTPTPNKRKHVLIKCKNE